MAFVEGIGDEVVGLFVAIIVITIIALLWSTTHVQERVPVVVQVLSNVNQSPATVPSDFPSDPGEGQSQSHPSGDTNDVVAEQEVVGISTQNVSQTENNVETEVQGRIKIRCQFLDETSLHVETSLSERISGLKSRHLVPHLGLNLMNGDTVRLIFNGRVLQSENQTLGEAGITNNCVIHCLVHRSTAGSETERITGTNNNRTDTALDVSDLDLSNVCYPLLGSVLMAIWWCQVVYAHYFTLTSTLSLVSLTVLYLASAANAYLHN